MTRVLLTGGSGFLAAHVLETLLKHGTRPTRSRPPSPSTTTRLLYCAIVHDVAKEGAFDQAVKADPPFEAVIHTASPFHFNVKDVQKELLDPAIIGTTGILESIVKYAPTVKRVVITSSFASIIDGSKGLRKGYSYSEKDWNPITHEEALQNPSNGYRASKTMAEKAAWDFVDREKPSFSISTMCPPLVLGPVIHHLSSLSHLNTSNERIRNIIQGKNKDQISETGTYLWVDVRDIALAHVKAIEIEAAANQRYFVTAGHFSNKEIVEVVRKNFPEYADKLPAESAAGGDYPKEGIHGFDNSKVERDLGIRWTPFEKSITDAVRSLQTIAD